MSAPFASRESLHDALRSVGYLADDTIVTVALLAHRLGKPVLAEGPAGTGKTALAKALADLTGARLVRLQCYEGLDEAKVLYEWDYRRQLLRMQASGSSWEEVRGELFSDEYLLERPLLEAIRSDEPVVLLVDEVDRVEVETEALLLEVLAELQVTVPELGTLRARSTPTVVLTSNGTRDLSDALKRRCLYLHAGYPTTGRELAIVRSHLPEVDAALAERVVEVVGLLRSLDLEKAPSIAETVDWVRALAGWEPSAAGPVEDLVATLPVVLKHRADLERGADALRGQT